MRGPSCSPLITTSCIGSSADVEEVASDCAAADPRVKTTDRASNAPRAICEQGNTLPSVDRRPGVRYDGGRGVIHPSEIYFLQLKRTAVGFHNELLAVRRKSIFFNHGRTELRLDIDDELPGVP